MVVALALIVALSGITILPLESHEAFVLASAQTMYDTGDWIVPWFNDGPRLTKPPLEYWLTALAAYLAGGIADIQPWHGRLPSALAAVGMVALTVLAGRRLFGAREGLLAGLMLASSSGFYTYAHSARPEMVYAFFSMAALACYIRADESADGSLAQRISGLSMWISFALATLTKGPQIPAIFLAAFAADLAFRKRGLRAAMLRLQPFGGLALFALITLPWWWLLQREIGGLQDTQLSGKLLKPDVGNILDPYYLWRPFQLMLPWALALPALFLVPWKKLRQSQWLPLGLVAVSALALSFGPQKRWYYMLPLLGPMFLVLAPGVVELLERLRQRSGLARHGGWTVAAVPFIVMVVVNSPSVVSKEKSAEESLAVAARAAAERGMELAAWDVSAAEVFVYHARRKVTLVGQASELPALVAKAGSRGLLLVMRTERLGELPPGLRSRPVKQVGVPGRGLVLVSLS